MITTALYTLNIQKADDTHVKTTLGRSNDVIEKDVVVTIDNGATLGIDGATVTLNQDVTIVVMKCCK